MRNLLIGLILLASPAQAQSWDRSPNSATIISGGDVLTLACQRGVASIDMNTEGSIRDRSVRATFTVDGQTAAELPMRVVRDGEVIHLIYEVNMAAQNDWALHELSLAMADGRNLIISASGVQRTFSLQGARRALEGVFSNCGEAMTGTGVWN